MVGPVAKLLVPEEEDEFPQALPVCCRLLAPHCTPAPSHKVLSKTFWGGSFPVPHPELSTSRSPAGVRGVDNNSPVPGCGPGTAPRTPPAPPSLPAAQLDPPALRSIQSVPPQTDCVALAWAVAPSSAHMELRCELRYRPPEDPAWALVSAAGGSGALGTAGTRIQPPPAPSSARVCALLSAPLGTSRGRLQPPGPSQEGCSSSILPAVPS